MLAEAITPSKCNGQDQCTTGTMQFYTYAGSIDNESIVVSSGIVKGSQTVSSILKLNLDMLVNRKIYLSNRNRKQMSQWHLFQYQMVTK